MKESIASRTWGRFRDGVDKFRTQVFAVGQPGADPKTRNKPVELRRDGDKANTSARSLAVYSRASCSPNMAILS